MDLEELEDRWSVWTVQARRFARKETYPDAVARMKLVCRSIEEALQKADDPLETRRLETRFAAAHDLLSELEDQLEAWRSKIAARRQQTIDSAAEEMARPLPTRSE
jgi:hypothetical protein